MASGHHHNLQLLTLELPGPALQLISGGGSSRRPFLDPPLTGRRFGIETTGFARIDVLANAAGGALVVSIYTMPRYPIVFWPRPRQVTSWWVDPSGMAYETDPEP